MSRTADEATFDTNELKLLVEALAGIFGAGAGSDVTRELEEFGIHQMLAEQPNVVVPLVFDQQGRAAATSRTLQELLLELLRGQLESHGSVDVGTVLISPTAADGLCAVATTDHRFSIHGLAVGGVSPQPLVLAGGLLDERVTLLAFDPRSTEVTLVSSEGLDPALNCVSVRSDGATAVVAIQSAEAATAWQNAVDWSRIALASEILGAVSFLLSLSQEYARERTQFGRAIGSFQAIKHKLAEVRIALDAASAATQAAAAEPGALSALVAKSMAGRAGRIATTNCLQTFGGIGFTWEHEYHRYMKRILMLDQLFGSASELPSHIGKHVLASGTVPRLVEL